MSEEAAHAAALAAFVYAVKRNAEVGVAALLQIEAEKPLASKRERAHRRELHLTASRASCIGAMHASIPPGTDPDFAETMLATAAQIHTERAAELLNALDGIGGRA